MNAPAPRQLPLPLSLAPEPRGPLLPDASNAAARAWLRDPSRWPALRLCLWGPEGVGKSHLLADLAEARGWRLLPGPALPALPAPGPAAVDDADCAPEEALLHLINANAARGLPLLLAGRAAPGRWPVALPDLASRLAATAAVKVEEPSEALIAALLAREAAERQIRLPEATRAFLLRHLPREARAVRAAARRLDRLSL
ncbi:MAG: chromosomal replication initiator DnaA, partial [Acetobacteraceae bacterium]|nr:chromosomal replication initiator DnaA [Acetobacteraceae bacterium]